MRAQGTALLVSLLVLGASPALAQDGAVDRQQLEALCAENTTSDKALSTCLEVVRTYLAPADGTDRGSASIAEEKVSLSGKGESASASVDLEGGDYLLRFSVAKSDSRREGCIASGGLRSGYDDYEVASFFSETPKGQGKKIETYVYSLDPGPYYVVVDDTSCPGWTVDIEPVPTEPSEPASGRVVRSGEASGRYSTEAFDLDGGDYVVTYTLDGGKQGCGLTAGLMSVSEGPSFGSLVDIKGEALQRKSDSGSARLTALEPGRYYWSVDASSGWFAGFPCPWSLIVEPS
jgi:hypothetical protein